VTVAVSPPLDGNVSVSVNVLAPVSAPTFAAISTRGWGRDCAAAGMAARVATPSTAAAQKI